MELHHRTHVTKWEFIFGLALSRQLRLAVTNYHVIRGSQQADVFFPALRPSGDPVREIGWYFEERDALETLGLFTPAVVLAQDIDSDLAILRLDFVPQAARGMNYKLPTSSCVADEMSQGAPLHFLGNPSITYQDENGRQVPIGLWQWGAAHFGQCHNGEIYIAAGVFRGNSGGPLIDDNSALIGIIKTSDMGTSAAAVPISEVFLLFGKLLQYAVISIKNNTEATIPYLHRTPPAEEWTNSDIGPGECKGHFFSGPPSPEAILEVAFDADPSASFRPMVATLRRTGTYDQVAGDDCPEPWRYEFSRGTDATIRLGPLLNEIVR